MTAMQQHSVSTASDFTFKLTENTAIRCMSVEKEDAHHKEKWWFSVYDFINIVYDKDIKDGFSVTKFTRLIEKGAEHKEELESLRVMLKFSGRGQRNTPCMTMRGLQRLLMILGGKVAAKYREIVEGVFTRHQAGDRSMIAEILANAASNAPVNQAFRTALNAEPVSQKSGGVDVQAVVPVDEAQTSTTNNSMMVCITTAITNANVPMTNQHNVPEHGIDSLIGSVQTFTSKTDVLAGDIAAIQARQMQADIDNKQIDDRVEKLEIEKAEREKDKQMLPDQAKKQAEDLAIKLGAEKEARDKMQVIIVNVQTDFAAQMKSL